MGSSPDITPLVVANWKKEDKIPYVHGGGNIGRSISITPWTGAGELVKFLVEII